MQTQSGNTINPIGIGTWMIGGGWDNDLSLSYADYEKDQESIEGIQYSISKGQNHIDTAHLYGMGHCEEIVGQAIKPFKRENLFIASKVWKTHTQRKAMIPHVEEMLRRLEIDSLDLIYLHSAKNPFPLEETIAGLNDIVDNGLAKGLAVSNFSLEQLQRAQSLSKNPILANQILYNLLDNSAAPNELLAYMRKEGIYTVAYRPIRVGLLQGNCTNEVVLDMARKYNVTTSQIALNWLITQELTWAIPKSVNKNHIDENLKAVEIKISSEDLKKLSEVIE